jgi:hypothetical protein
VPPEVDDAELFPSTAIELPLTLTGALTEIPIPDPEPTLITGAAGTPAGDTGCAAGVAWPRMAIEFPSTFTGKLIDICMPDPLLIALLASLEPLAEAIPAPMAQSPPVSSTPCRPRFTQWFMVLPLTTAISSTTAIRRRCRRGRTNRPRTGMSRGTGQSPCASRGRSLGRPRACERCLVPPAGRPRVPGCGATYRMPEVSPSNSCRWTSRPPRRRRPG